MIGARNEQFQEPRDRLVIRNTQMKKSVRTLCPFSPCGPAHQTPRCSFCTCGEAINSADAPRQTTAPLRKM